MSNPIKILIMIVGKKLISFGGDCGVPSINPPLSQSIFFALCHSLHSMPITWIISGNEKDIWCVSNLFITRDKQSFKMIGGEKRGLSVEKRQLVSLYVNLGGIRAKIILLNQYVKTFVAWHGICYYKGVKDSLDILC